MAARSPDAEAAARRFRTALELCELAEDIFRQKLRRDRPEADEAEIEALVVQWRRTRPGAEHGDSVGRPIPWPRTAR